MEQERNSSKEHIDDPPVIQARAAVPQNSQQHPRIFNLQAKIVCGNVGFSIVIVVVDLFLFYLSFCCQQNDLIKTPREERFVLSSEIPENIQGYIKDLKREILRLRQYNVALLKLRKEDARRIAELEVIGKQLIELEKKGSICLIM